MWFISSVFLVALTTTFAVANGITEKRKSELSNLVIQDCGSCHGLTLKGGLGTALTPKDLKEQEIESLTAIILDGVPGTPMPPWRGLLTEDEAVWIAEGLKKGRFK